ncbi:MAG: EH signature domain-containing protein [Rhodocyclaceae bacterium]
MSLELLSSLLHKGNLQVPETLHESFAANEVFAQVERRCRANKPDFLAKDRQMETIHGFWRSNEILCFRDVYYLSWGLSLPIREGGPCVLEDESRFRTVLKGLDDWTAERPAMYRRCYQGLARSYFTYDVHDPRRSSESGRTNWATLRDYLHNHTLRIADIRVNPEWVEATLSHRQLFSAEPYAAFERELLAGDSERFKELCRRIGIPDGSWFLREVILARVKAAVRQGHTEFLQQLNLLVPLVVQDNVLCDRGLKLLLDRYAQVPNHPLHVQLRDASVGAWGNPWLPSNVMAWGGVVLEARAMVSDWLKLEFIETFFTKLADDGLADPRRMNFWKRYVKAISGIEFALGATARNSYDSDMKALRKKMTGLTCRLEASGNNNAFIMRMGSLVAVEFSSEGNAFYGYDARKNLPFDSSKSLYLEVDGFNSLKNRSRKLWMSHTDGNHGWAKWEQMFEAEFRNNFGIEPLKAAAEHLQVKQSFPSASASMPEHPKRQQAAPLRFETSQTTLSPHRFPGGEVATPRAIKPASLEPRESPPIPDFTRMSFSGEALERLASTYGLQIDDKTSKGGNLWVRTNDTSATVAQTLTRWKFRHAPGKGWYRSI